MDAAHRRRLLGEVLVEEGLVSAEQLAAALAEQQRTGQRLGTILVNSGMLNGSAVAMALADQQGSLVRSEYGWATGWKAARDGRPHRIERTEPRTRASHAGESETGAPNPPATTNPTPDEQTDGTAGEGSKQQPSIEANRPGPRAESVDLQRPSARELEAIASEIAIKRQELHTLTSELEQARAELHALRDENPSDEAPEPDSADFIVIAAADGKWLLQLGRGTPPPTGATLRLASLPNTTFIVERTRHRHCLYVKQLPPGRT